MDLSTFFNSTFPIIGCVHLQPLPGSPGFSGDLKTVRDQALSEAQMLEDQGVHGLIIENFGDTPFYKKKVPAHTIANMTSIARDIRKQVQLPIGINVLRNDAEAALCIAQAVEAQFIRINIHMHAMVTDQGLVEGKSYRTLRLRKLLQTDIKIFADINVKHASSIVKPDLLQWSEDLIYRGRADALIVSGSGTGKSIDEEELLLLSKKKLAPIILGSGVNTDNLLELSRFSDAAIVGSYFKEEGVATNNVSSDRIRKFILAHGSIDK